MNPQEALKMVTLNPAKMLHVEDQVGSLKVGKDADIVVWTADPLSIYARVQWTIVDGVIYFDKEKDEQLQASIKKERELLIEKMIAAKKSGEASQPIKAEPKHEDSCEDDHPKGDVGY
jgi:cytosine/adenosine deaminase-related metal-dependent hydrolase